MAQLGPSPAFIAALIAARFHIKPLELLRIRHYYARMDRSIPIERALRRGPRTTAELAALINVSSSTITRALADIPTALTMGRARASLHGLADRLRGLPTQAHPVYRVAEDGSVVEIGRITAVVGADFWWENLIEPERSRKFDSLPWFLNDMRPQGFLGRLTVRHFASQGWPSRLEVWSERDTLAAMLLGGAHDSIGNLLIGDRALSTYRILRPPLLAGFPAEIHERLDRYGALVVAMGKDATAGPSANGEQPKFCAVVDGGSAERPLRHLLVKFTAPTVTEAGCRWSDLLVMEERCLASVRDGLGIPAAVASYHAGGGRAYLEVERFDRTPGGGRRGVISFSSLDAEFVGAGENWTVVADALVEQGHLERAAVRTVRRLEHFGALVGNTDRHLGNISVHFDGVRPCSLTPVYDFLPMRYAPTTVGMPSEPLTTDQLARAPVEGLSDDDLIRGLSSAAAFWRGCSQDPRISAPMLALCAANAAAVERLGAL